MAKPKSYPAAKRERLAAGLLPVPAPKVKLDTAGRAVVRVERKADATALPKSTG